MALTAAQLNRTTLMRQSLVTRASTSVAEAVAQVVALQAQEPMSPYLALWNRIEGFDAGDLDAAFADAVVIKAPLMRITLHAVLAVDYPAFHEAMLPTLRAARLNDRRFRETGFTVDEADALVPGLVGFANRLRTKDEMLGHLEAALGAEVPQHLWWALRTYAPLAHGPTGGPWSFGRSPSYVAAPSGDPSKDALGNLARRYLSGFGPASIADIAQFTLRRRSEIRKVLGRCGDVEEREGPDGQSLFDLSGAAVSSGDSQVPPRLLGMWDSVLLAYADRSRIIPEDLRRVVIRQNGDVLPAVLVDGYVHGVWRPRGGGVEARVFREVSAADWASLTTEAAGLVRLWARRRPTYGRYDHWWGKLPRGETRLLAV
jgi:hypothetical protein